MSAAIYLSGLFFNFYLCYTKVNGYCLLVVAKLRLFVVKMGKQDNSGVAGCITSLPPSRLGKGRA